jgi:hypothetical protein
MSQATAPIRHTDRFYIGGQWVEPSSDAKVSVIDSDTEQLYFTVPEAQAADISRAVGAAREAFDHGPWPSLTHDQRAEYLRAIGAELKRRSEDIGQIRRRGRRGADRQRHDLRAERLGVHQRRQPGPPGRRAAAVGHGRAQRDAHGLRR